MCSGLNPVGYLGSTLGGEVLTELQVPHWACTSASQKPNSTSRLEMFWFFALHLVWRTENVCVLGDAFTAGQ